MAGARLLISDLDGTLVGDDEALARFAAWFDAHRVRMRLAYNTGRFYPSVCDLVRTTPLPAPDAVICGVGTENRLFPSGEKLDGWPPCRQPWNRSAIQSLLARIPELKPQPDELQSEFKLSYYATDLDADFLSRLRRRLAASGYAVEIVYSSNRDLDVLPAGVNKGSAAAFLAAHLGFRPERVIVAGDTGNDASMFASGFRGIVVGNAQPELKAVGGANVYRSSRPYADGVLDGLAHWLQLPVATAG